ncbi:MAG: hypothetical protein ACT4NY_19365 [Pseudonocardiales bacterium]
MRILHLIPVGLSLLDQIKALPTLRSALAVDELPDAVYKVHEALFQAAGQDYVLDLNRLGLTGVHRAASALDPSMAAEWTSVKAIRAEIRHGAVTRDGGVDGEAYVFIATDSDDGLRAAILVAACYQSTIHYLHEPLKVGNLLVRPGDVYVCRIPDLDLGNIPPTSKTWRSLGTIGRLVADTAKQTGGGDWNVVVHLSGGYKAMIPYVMVLAEGVHSRLRKPEDGNWGPPKIRAVAIHDPSTGRNPTISRILIDVPVRAISPDLLARVAKLKKLTRPDSDIVGAGAPLDLLGLCIEREGPDDYRVSDPGLIMVNVL